LLAGSEGTLAVMRRATVNLVRRPKHTILGVLAYESIVDACDDVPRLLEFKPSAIELIPQMIIRLARSVPAYARQMGWMTGDPAAVLVIEFSGDNRGPEVRFVFVMFAVAESPKISRIWNVRKVGLNFDSVMARPPRSSKIALCLWGTWVNLCEMKGFAEHKTVGGITRFRRFAIRPILDLQRSEGVRACEVSANRHCGRYWGAR
jgi:hypothetical protein